MIDTTLIEKLGKMAAKEKKIKAFKSRLHVKGIVIAKSFSKKGHLNLKVKKGEDEYTFTILKTHKEKFAIADKLPINSSISIEGINRFRVIICTRMKVLTKAIDQSKQVSLNAYAPLIKTSSAKTRKKKDGNSKNQA